MSTLRELDNDLMLLMEMLEEEPDSEVLRDTLEGLAGELEIKYEGYCTVISAYKNQSDNIKQEIERLKTRKLVADNAVERLKGALFQSMQISGKRKIQGNIYTVSLRKTAPQLDQVPKELPDDYLIAQEPVVDRKKLLADVKAGKVIDGVTLRQGECLIIK